MVTSVLVSPQLSLHRFSHLKIWLLFTFVLNYCDFEQRNETFREYFQRDLDFCKVCFQHQQTNCESFFSDIELYTWTWSQWRHMIDILPGGSKRAAGFLKFKSNNGTEERKIIAKYMTQQNLNAALPPSAKTTSQCLSHLKQRFLDSDRLDGLQVCPAEKIDRLVEYLREEGKISSLLSIWLHLNVNVEPLLMPLLETLGFPVPKNINVCGFTLYQAYAGKALVHFYDSDFKLKLRIARQLLKAALQFSEGFAGFRILITDLSADNLVFDERTQKLYIVDLDTALIVDSAESENRTHKHIYIDCDNCFAYSQQDICEHGRSDINLFSACQLLREDLNRQREAGFLHPIPGDLAASYPNFQRLLDTCVDCFDSECSCRFAATLDLIQLIDVILKNFY